MKFFTPLYINLSDGHLSISRSTLIDEEQTLVNLSRKKDNGNSNSPQTRQIKLLTFALKKALNINKSS